MLKLYFTGISIGFNPVGYTVIEGVNDTVVLRVVKTGDAAVPVSVNVATVPGTAQGIF